MYCDFLGGITAKTNFNLILSSPDDECFQFITLFLVSVQYIYQFPQNQN